MTNLIQDVKPRGIESACIEAPFNIGKKILENNGYKIISLEENAKLRMQEGKDAYCSKNGNWVQEDFIYVPGKGVYLTKDSSICENTKEATNCHRKNQEFYLNEEQVEKSLANSILISRDTKNFEIPTSEFKNNKIANYIFGKYAEDYGNFLRETGIRKMPFWFVNLEDKSFARKVWFWDLVVSSGGENKGLGSNRRSRGVKKLK